MTCHQLAELLPDYLQRSLSAEKTGLIAKHLEECAECREQAELWGKLSALPEERPSPVVRTRFERMLNAYEEGRWEHESLKAERRSLWPDWLSGTWFRAPLMQSAFALAILVVGLAVGLFGGRYLANSNSNSREIATLHEEVTRMRQLVVLSMLQQQSASERLQGVSMSLQASHPDPEVVSALLHTLRYDTSVDVRLAALDALRRYNAQPKVRQGLVDALQGQQSPLVQIALIDLLVEVREANAVQQIKKFQENPNLNPVVRQRAEWGISKLSRG